ncbi:MAG: hypothetical protein JNM80_10755 [Phycisphaerae bacterium]|nr:hypothetical protein [Phycisphaerae bacterium]
MRIDAARAIAHLAGLDSDEEWVPRPARSAREGDLDRQRLERALAEALTEPQGHSSVEQAPDARRVGRLATSEIDPARKILQRTAARVLGPSGLAWSEHRRNPLGAWFRGEAGQDALRQWVRDDDHSLDAAWTWLTRDHLASACLDRLAKRASVDAMTVLLSRSHLRLHPARARRLTILPRPPARGGTVRRAMLPEPSAAGALAARARRGYVHLVAALPMPEAERERRLEPCLSDPDAMVRLAATRVLRGSSLADYCFDADPAVAASATLRLALQPADSVRAHVLAGLARSAHSAVRILASDAAPDPWNPNVAASRLQARLLLRADREGFLAALRARLSHAEAGQRIAAIILARRLGVVGEIELELLSRLSASTRTPDVARDRVAATAVVALADAETPSARSAVRACLRHPEDRVRANAVEAAASALAPIRSDRPLYASLLELRTDTAARVRANAALALLRAASPSLGGDGVEPEAVHALLALLCDARDGHRLSGCWAATRALAGHAGAGVWSVQRRRAELVSRVRSLATGDPSEAVRVRAVDCLRRLEGMRPVAMEVA